MKIAVNTRLLLHNRMDGIGWFAFEQFRRICRNHPEHEFHFIFDRPYDPAFIFSDNIVPHVIGPQARHPLLFKIWYNFSVPRLLKRIGADIFVSPDMICSLTTKLPQIVVLHDLNFEHYPQDLPRIVSHYLRKNTPRFAQVAKGIVTVSEFSKQDILSCYGVKSEKVDVVYNGCHASFTPLSETQKDLVRSRFTGGMPYFLFVSSIHPRKNLQRLLPAFDRFKKRSGSDVKLVVVGRKFWKFPELDAVYESMEFQRDVIFTGRLESEELRDVTGAALASAYISYYEGFGLPILEAFNCGVPVITSNVSAMPEVAGDAAILVNPFSVEEIADALCLVWSDEALRQTCIERGLVRAKYFSWDKAALEFWDIIEKRATT